MGGVWAERARSLRNAILNGHENQHSETGRQLLERPHGGKRSECALFGQ